MLMLIYQSPIAHLYKYTQVTHLYDNAITEAVSFQMPCSLRIIFATIIVFCKYTNIHALWDKHFESIAEDYRHFIEIPQVLSCLSLETLQILSLPWVKILEVMVC